MSGGSLNYVYSKLDDVIPSIEDSPRPLHKAFAAHLTKVSKALRDLEWEWSGDSSGRSSDAAIEALLAPGDELNEAIKLAENALQSLQYTLNRAKGNSNA